MPSGKNERSRCMEHEGTVPASVNQRGEAEVCCRESRSSNRSDGGAELELVLHDYEFDSFEKAVGLLGSEVRFVRVLATGSRGMTFGFAPVVYGNIVGTGQLTLN